MNQDLDDKIRFARENDLRMIAVDENLKDLFDPDLGLQPLMLTDNKGIVHYVNEDDISSSNFEKEHRTMYADGTTYLEDKFLHGHNVRDGSVSYLKNKEKIIRRLNENGLNPLWIDIRNTGGKFNRSLKYRFEVTNESESDLRDTRDLTPDSFNIYDNMTKLELEQVLLDPYLSTTDFNHVTNALKCKTNKSSCAISGGKKSRNRKSRNRKSRNRKSRKNRRKSRR